MFGSSFGMMLFLFQFFYGTHDTDTCDMHCNGNKMKLAVCMGHGTIVTDSSLLMRDIEHVTETTDTTN